MHAFEVELLHGLNDVAGVQRLARLRGPTGRDQALMAGLAGAPPAVCISAIIACLMLRIGDRAEPSRDRLLSMTAGDRERVLLALCRYLLGPEVDLVVPCPSCRSLCELQVSFADLMTQHPAPSNGRCTLAAEDGSWTARIRPPTGHDLEEAARGEAGSARRLLENCLSELVDPSGRSIAGDGLPRECETALGEAIAALDPIAECRIGVDCPHCATSFDTLLDGFTLLRTAIGDANDLYGDVYRMARSYHWSEAEILDLPLKRRRHYLAIVQAEEGHP